MKSLLVLPQSFVDPKYEFFISHIKDLEGFDVLLFKNFEETMNIAGLSDRFKNFKSKLKQKNIRYHYVQEYNFDEYVYQNHLDELYLSPTSSEKTIITSLALIKGTNLNHIKGVYILEGYNQTLRQYNFYNIKDAALIFNNQRTFGMGGLDNQSANNQFNYPDTCYFNINGQNYSQTLRYKDSLNQGAEGVTFNCQDDSRYILKIYSRLMAVYEFDKIKMMINQLAEVTSLSDVAIPKSLIYDKNHNEVGIVMNKFSGKEIKLSKLHKRDTRKKYNIIKNLLEQCITLESYGLYHKDLIHNILIDDDKAHIIDVDTTQFRDMPARASAYNKQNNIPKIYDSNKLFFNTIDLSYSLITILVSFITDPTNVFGEYIDDKIELNKNALDVFKREAPSSIYKIVKDAFVKLKPVSLSEMFHVLNDHESEWNRICNVDWTKIVWSPVNSANDYLDPEKENRNQDCFTKEQDNRFHGDYFSSKQVNISNQDYNNSSYKSDNLNQSSIQKTKVADFGRRRKKLSFDEPYTVKTERKKDPTISLIKKVILSLYMNNYKTSISDESDYEKWQRFINEKLYKKPLMLAIIGLAMIVMLIIGIIIL